jgi:hypothetical protein
MSETNKIQMNKELQEWIEESKKSIQINKKNNKKLKKPTGICQICGEKKSESICLKCNKSICSSCFFKLIGVCKKCVPTDIAEKWEGKQPDWEKILGVEWVD